MWGHRRDGGTRDIKKTQGLTGTWSQAKGGKWGAQSHVKRRQTPACGAGLRGERWGPVGGGCRRRPGGWRFDPGEEVGSGCKLREGFYDERIWMRGW